MTTESFRLRELDWQDHDAVHALWLEVFGAIKPDDAPQRLRRTLERNPGLFLVAEQDGRVVGTTLGAWDGRRGHLYHVAVAPTHRRRGIARALVLEVARRLFALGSGHVHLRVTGDNAGAIAFYHALGFSSDPPVMGMRLTPSGP